jgi:hypothetical protein
VVVRGAIGDHLARGERLAHRPDSGRHVSQPDWTGDVDRPRDQDLLAQLPRAGESASERLAHERDRPGERDIEVASTGGQCRESHQQREIDVVPLGVDGRLQVGRRPGRTVPSPCRRA